MKYLCTRFPGPLGRGMALPLLMLACAALFLGGCPAPAYDPALLVEASAIGNQQRWPEARPLIQQHLLKYPEDPLGHFYYGLSFLHLAEPQLTLAEGELLTAQALIERGQPVPDGVFDGDLQKFMGELYQKTALVYIRAFREALVRDVPYEYSRVLLKKALAQTELGLEAYPDSLGLKDYAKTLNEYLHGTPERTPDIMTRSGESGAAI